jgi:hypothetical protein
VQLRAHTVGCQTLSHVQVEFVILAALKRSGSQKSTTCLQKQMRRGRSVFENCLQPELTKSDEQFKHDQTLHSTCVEAAIRLGNEHAVKVVNNLWRLIKSEDVLIGFGVI